MKHSPPRRPRRSQSESPLELDLCVLDILCGASAGGVNGSLLAAALRSARRLPADLLRDRWLELGDFSKLLRPTTEQLPL